MTSRAGTSISMLLTAVLLASATVVAGAPPQASGATIGSVEMNGDPTFDSDSLADPTGTQYRWGSYPGARLALNANQASDVKAPAGPMNNRLSLGLGGWFGTEAVNLNDIVRTELAVPSGSAHVASSHSTTWYPYKIGFSASYTTPTGTSLTGYDFMKDADATVMRVINVSSSVNNEVVLSGAVTGPGGAQWIGGSDKVVLVSDSDYYYAIHVVSLSGSSLTPVELLETATIGGGQWTYRKTFAGSGNLGVSIGIAAASEGSATAIDRALDAFGQPVVDTLADTKADFDGWLQDVPAPSNWGISGVADYGVTAAQHEKMYYSAWAFLLQDLVDPLPENSVSYPYPQMMAGKPSLWNVGSPGNPGTAQWESVFGYQFLSYLMPETAWQAYLGLLSEVDVNGMIGGESLPTRLAQTAWVLYENSGNATHLAAAYPDLKRFLDWTEDNPRWICCGHDIPEEKDLEFVSSWLFDAEFAIKIADELGIAADVTMWENKRDAMIDDLDDLFFKDPDVIYGVAFPYTEIPPEWAVGNDMFKTTALSIADLPVSQLNRLRGFFMSIHRPDADLDNFHYHKYPDVSLILYGLLNNDGHVQAEEFAQSSLRDTIRGKQFAEVLIPTSTGLRTDSVAPSLFTAAQTIELTWMLNGVRLDSGAPTAFSFGNSTLTVPNSPDVLPTIEDFSDISDWTNPYNSFMSADSGAGMIRYEDVEGGNVGYGVVEKQVTYDVDVNPKLRIDIGALYEGGGWALKVNDGSGDVTLQSDTGDTGVKTLDLRAATGWSGTKTFTIRFYVLSGKVKVQDISVPSVALETFTSPTGWTTTNATFSATSGIGQVTSTTTFGGARKSFTYNVDDFPNLVIKVPDTSSQWSLKVNDGGVDIPLQTDTNFEGERVFNLKSITGWSGTKTFSVVVYAVGGTGAYVKVDYLTRAR